MITTASTGSWTLPLHASRVLGRDPAALRELADPAVIDQPWRLIPFARVRLPAAIRASIGIRRRVSLGHNLRLLPVPSLGRRQGEPELRDAPVVERVPLFDAGASGGTILQFVTDGLHRAGGDGMDATLHVGAEISPRRPAEPIA